MMKNRRLKILYTDNRRRNRMKLSKAILILSVGLAVVCLSACNKGSDVSSPTGSTPSASRSTGPAQFSESRPPVIVKLQNSVVAGGQCNMESINGVGWSTEPPYVAHQNDNVSIIGWGVDDQAKRLPTSIFLRFQLGTREFYAPIETLRIARTDLVAYTKQDYVKDSGYRADASLANLPPGDYQAMIV